MKVGDRATMARRVTPWQVKAMAAITGDKNPLHLDDEFPSRFGGRIVHGLFPLGLVSALLGTEMPGPGTVYLSQSAWFRAPVRPGELMEAEIRVVSVDGKRAKLYTTVSVGDTVVMDGEAEVLMP
jgi:3-hydroxybutyryl-CoA dehydratase